MERDMVKRIFKYSGVVPAEGSTTILPKTITPRSFALIIEFMNHFYGESNTRYNQEELDDLVSCMPLDVLDIKDRVSDTWSVEFAKRFTNPNDPALRNLAFSAVALGIRPLIYLMFAYWSTFFKLKSPDEILILMGKDPTTINQDDVRQAKEARKAHEKFKNSVVEQIDAALAEALASSGSANDTTDTTNDPDVGATLMSMMHDGSDASEASDVDANDADGDDAIEE
jgi:hypothetical protein